MNKEKPLLTCLFCKTPDVLRESYFVETETIVNENGEVVPVKTEDGFEKLMLLDPSSGIITAHNDSLEDFHIRSDLKSLFIVRRLLDLPLEKCVGYLQSNGDGTSRPGTWLTVCASCNEVVKECYQVHKQLSVLERKLEKLKMGLKSTIKNTTCFDEVTGPVTDETTGRVFEDIRATVLLDPSLLVSAKPKKEKVNREDSSSSSRSTQRRSPRSKTRTEQLFPSVEIAEYYGDWQESFSPISNSIEDDTTADSDWKLCDDQKSPKTPESNKTKLSAAKRKKDESGSNEGSPKKVRKRRPLYNYVCGLCPAVYKTLDLSSKHRKLHQSNESVACPKCGWLCEKEKLCHHIRIRHRLKGVPNWKSNTNHERKTIQVHNKIPYYCDHCHIIYINEARLQRHYYASHTGKPLVPCEKCEKEFISKQLLKIHMTTDHPETIIPPDNDEPSSSLIPHNCPHCSETFQSKESMDYHISLRHMNKLLECQFCDFKAGRLDKLRRHIATHHENNKLICELCSKTFDTRSGLKFHMNQCHPAEIGVDPFTCPHCNVNYPNQRCLDNHIKCVHEQQKSHFCEFCGKAFGRSCDLKKHILLHTTTREFQYKKGPFICKFCKAEFNVRQGLYYHMKKAHSDKYGFRCKKCGKGYSVMYSLVQHETNCSGATGSNSVNVELGPEVN